MASRDGEKDLPVTSHKHCQNCIRALCTVTEAEQDACRMVSCELSCGWRCHQCKMEEHVQLCPEERVPCTNSSNGCPLQMARKKLAQHLQYCPASVITCPIEWNRWPMHSQEQGIRISLPPVLYAFQCNQLDVGLAMRDQRMLMESLRAPRSTKRVLRNSLTMRYPAAPIGHRSSSVESDLLNSEGTSRTASDDEADTPWDLARLPPGLQKSICSRLYSASKQTTESLSAALDVMSNHMSASPASAPEKMKLIKREAIVCKHCRNRMYGKKNEPEGCGAEGDTDKDGECQEGGREEEEGDGDASSMVCEVGSTKTHDSSETEEDVMESYCTHGAACNSKGTFWKCALTSDLDTEENSKTESGEGETSEDRWKLYRFLGVDINIECIMRYQAKPPAMYTFLCAQDFRRDEYPWHFANVHCDIQCGLNGWMEQRCPLAHQGCPFTTRRLHPAQRGATLIHSPLQESFALRYEDTPCHPGQAESLKEMEETIERELTESSGRDLEIETGYRWDSPVKLSLPDKARSRSEEEEGHDFISKLPFEVLQSLVRYLDAFSLRNLSLVSKLMREVCCSLLEERGIVSLVWERSTSQGQPHWQVVAKRWQFSCSFSPIRQWVFEDRNPISEHLKTCPYNQDRVLASAPFSIIPVVNDPMDDALRRLLAERHREFLTCETCKNDMWDPGFPTCPTCRDDIPGFLWLHQRKKERKS